MTAHIWLATAERPASARAAAEVLAAWLQPFVRFDPTARLARRHLARLLDRGSLAPMPGDLITHRLTISGGCETTFDQATIRLRIRGEFHSDRPGVEIEIESSGEMAELTLGFRTAVSRREVTGGWLGHPDHSIDNLNLLSYVTAAPTGMLPAGSSVEPCGAGFLLWAAPVTATGAQVLSAVRILHSALRAPRDAPRRLEQLPRPQPTGPMPPQQPGLVPVQPSALAPPMRVLPAPPPEPNPDETLPITGPVNVTELPFSGSTGDETLQALFRSPSPAELAPSDGEALMDETLMLPPTASTPSRGRAAPAIPLMTVERYAELRAHLLVLGEEHEPTLQRFGLGSRDARELLKLRFVSMFADDEPLRDRFVARMQELAAELRRKEKSST